MPACCASTGHADLGDLFYDPVKSARFPQHVIRHRNQAWAGRIGLGSLADAEWIERLRRFTPLPGSLPQPLALRCHGHQSARRRASASTIPISPARRRALC